MHCCSLSHLSESGLRSSSRAVHADERTHTAVAIAHVGEVEARGQHVAWGYSTISAYCIEELRLSHAAAFKRIRVAHTARQFPVIFEYLIQGRLHLGSVLMLSPKLTPENADELLSAAAGKSKSEIDLLLAQWFPKADVPTRFAPIDSPDAFAPGRMAGDLAIAPGRMGTEPPVVPGRFEHAKLAPLSANAYELRLTIEKSTRDKLGRLQELLSHQISPSDLPQILDRAFEIAVAELERRKYGATGRPRAGRGSSNRRYITNSVRRAVRERDGDRCSFVSGDRHRCNATRHLEFDHVVPIAQGGESTVTNVRLLCRAHNQHMAERSYGASFMQNKREEAVSAGAARRRAEQERATAEARAAEAARIAEETRLADEARAATQAREQETTKTVVSALGRLGYRDKDASEAAAFAAKFAPDASLEARVRKALTWFAPRGTFVARVGPDGRPAAASTGGVAARAAG